MTWRIHLIEAAEKDLALLPLDLKARFLRVAELLEAFGPKR